MPGLTYQDITNAQAGMNRDQLATAAQAATVPAPTIQRYTAPSNLNPTTADLLKTPGYSNVGGQLTYTGANPTNSSGLKSEADIAAEMGSDYTGGPVDENAIRENVRSQMQAQIDAIDREYANLISDQQKTNEENMGRTRAVNARAGLMGSDIGQANTNNQQASNDKAVQALRDEQAAKIAAVNADIYKESVAEITAKKQEAAGVAGAYSKYLSDQQTAAQGKIKSLGESGVTVDTLRDSDPKTLAYIEQATGMTDFQLQNALVQAAGENLKTDTKLVGDTAYMSTYNPVTGKMEVHAQKFDVPEGSLVDFGNGNIMVKKTDTNGKTTYESAVPQKPVEVGNGGTLVDPVTGKVIYQAPYRTTGSTSGGTGISGLYTPGADPTVDGWVKNIVNGKAKFSDVPKDLQNQVAQGVAASGGNNTTDILKTTKDSLKELQDMVDKNQGFSGAVGAKGISSLFGLKATPFAGTAAANFDAKLKQTVNDVVLPNLTLLHGLGRVTDREFQALTSSMTSLSTNLSESEFKKELKNLTDRINAINTSDQASGSSNTGQTSNGVTYTIQ